MDANIQATKELSRIEINKIKVNNKKIYKVVKRIIDIIGALVGCVVLVPLTLGIWIANSIAKDNGPVFYTHKRIGKNGKYFKLFWKYILN